MRLVFGWKIFNMWQLSQRHIVHNLRELKKNYIDALLDFICFLLLFVSFLEVPVFLNQEIPP